MVLYRKLLIKKGAWGADRARVSWAGAQRLCGGEVVLLLRLEGAAARLADAGSALPAGVAVRSDGH